MVQRMMNIDLEFYRYLGVCMYCFFFLEGMRYKSYVNIDF